LKEGLGLFSTETLEELQRQLNEKLGALGLRYFVKIDNFDVRAQNFEFTMISRYSFDHNEDLEQDAREVALKFLANWTLRPIFLKNTGSINFLESNADGLTDADDNLEKIDA
jgi:hypothetical protein